MATRITAKAEYIGPFFHKDLDKTIEENVQALLQGFARAGEEDIVRKLSAGQDARRELAIEGIDVTRVAQRVEGRVRSMTGAPWHRWAVVSPTREGLNPKQAIGLYASAAEIENKTHIFRTTMTSLRRAVKEMKQADLTRGLE